MSDNTYLDIKAAAAYVGKHPKTIRRWIADKNNPLPAYRLGHEYRIRPQDLDAHYQPVQAEPQRSEA